MKVHHQWTKAEIKTLLTLWESNSVSDIAEKLGVTTAQVNYMATEIRKINPTLVTKKRNKMQLRSLISEVLAELN